MKNVTHLCTDILHHVLFWVLRKFLQNRIKIACPIPGGPQKKWALEHVTLQYKLFNVLTLDPEGNYLLSAEKWALEHLTLQ